MEIVLLGVGEAFAKTLNQTNFLVRPAEGEPFLVDCGHTAPRALHGLGVPLRSISGVVVSHLHGDHVGGLEELGFSAHFLWGERRSLWAQESVLGYLWENCLKAGMGQRLRNPAGGFSEADLATYFDVHAVTSRAPFALGSVELTPFQTPHTPGRPSWGFRLDDRVTGRSALLTCDSKLHRGNLERFGAGVDLVFHDCRLEPGPGNIHATLNELLTLPIEWQRRIILVHYGDAWRDFEGRTGAMRFGEAGATYRL